MATKAPLVVAPAMNTGMYENPVVQQNLEILRVRGARIVEPASGRLACGDTGRGKLADPEDIACAIERAAAAQDLSGISVLVTAGPTREAMDPVRFLSNHSTGKMGYAIAESALARGAKVTLVSGPVALQPPAGASVVPVTSAPPKRLRRQRERNPTNVTLHSGRGSCLRMAYPHFPVEWLERKRTRIHCFARRSRSHQN